MAPNNPFAAIVVIDGYVTREWRQLVSEWLVKSGCLYMMAWGNECSRWDDSVDTANLEAFDWKIPKDKSVTTTWHEDETLEDVFDFAITAALPFSPFIKNIILLDISDISREHSMLSRYGDVQNRVLIEDTTLDEEEEEEAPDRLWTITSVIIGSLLIPIAISFVVKYWPYR